MLPALATLAQLAPLLGLSAAALEADEERTPRAQAALNAASSKVREAAGDRTFLDDDQNPAVPDKVLAVVLDAARRAFWLYGSGGAYTTTDEVAVDDGRVSSTRNLDAATLLGAELTKAERAVCAGAASQRPAGAYSVPLGTTWTGI